MTVGIVVYLCRHGSSSYSSYQEAASLIFSSIFLSQSPKKVGDDIAKYTQAWKGIKVTVKLTVANRNATVEVVPTATSLIIKELKEPPRDRKKVKNIKHNGNLPIETIITIARTMRESGRGIPSRTFAGTVKEILGTW